MVRQGDIRLEGGGEGPRDAEGVFRLRIDGAPHEGLPEEPRARVQNVEVSGCGR